MKEKKLYAKDFKCCVCGKQAEVFYPIMDPNISVHPYCKECATIERDELLERLTKELGINVE